MARRTITQHRLGLYTEAEKAAIEILEMGYMLGVIHPNTILAMNNLACIWYRLGNFDEAEALLAQAVDLDQGLNPEHPNALQRTSNLECMQAGRETRQRGDISDENEAAWVGEERGFDEEANSNGWETVADSDDSEEEDYELQDEPAEGEQRIAFATSIDVENKDENRDDTLDLLDLYTY